MFSELKDWWYRKRNGLVRTQPHGTRGRVYAPKNPPPDLTAPLQDGDRMIAKKIPKGTIGIRVFRADGSVEDHGTVPAVVTKGARQ